MSRIEELYTNGKRMQYAIKQATGEGEDKSSLYDRAKTFYNENKADIKDTAVGTGAGAGIAGVIAALLSRKENMLRNVGLSAVAGGVAGGAAGYNAKDARQWLKEKFGTSDSAAPAENA